MAISNTLLASLLVCLIAIQFVQTHQELMTDTDVIGHSLDGKKKVDCPKLCVTRCSKMSGRRICQKECSKCCERCNCVPPATAGDKEAPGTSGKKEECPCYTKKIGGKSKCP